MDKNQQSIYQKQGKLHFRIWAPKANSLSIIILNEGKENSYPMTPLENGFYEIALPSQENVDYFYWIDEEKKRPDPNSRSQPYGVHGPSRSFNPHSFEWSDSSWKGIPLGCYIVYELHVGTFTPEGTFEAIIRKLPFLKELGITAIELMPVIEFPGERNWGYDGTYPYAPHHAYGGPTGLQKLIDACHAAKLAVILDVVYNHLGPEGNYLGEFGFYFTDRYKTPWGKAVNFDGAYCDPVRKYFIDNALFWLNEYHVDALRLDAIHAIEDFSPQHLLEELRAAFHAQAQMLGKHAYIIAESDLNDIRILNPKEKGGYALDAQWSDDFHHSAHALLTGSKEHYFGDFGTVSDLAKALTNGFVYDGRWSEYRKKKFGSSSTSMPGQKFVACIQNHDQIGNAAQGNRLGSIINLEQYRLASALLMCTPYLPLLFMGQEWNAPSPFLFFTSYEDREVAHNVREGYKKEFRLDPHDHRNLDPQSTERFLQSKIPWEQLSEPEHQEMLHFYQRLIQLRKKNPCLSNNRKDLSFTISNDEEKWLILIRNDNSYSQAIFIANFLANVQTITVPFPKGKWSAKLITSATTDFPNLLNFLEPTEIPLELPGYCGVLYVKENN